ncbi:MAG: hypothetical protein EU547_04735 [Promethearchaeota archaeon]|nr:MAG: hypothetical protein EU547_04735 [Candidatus Lokiarchaeota archaeon]
MGLLDRILRRTKQTVEDAVDDVIDGAVNEVEDSIRDVIDNAITKRIRNLVEKALKSIEKVKDLADMTQEEIFKLVHDKIWDKIDRLVPDIEEVEEQVNKIIEDTIDAFLA